MGEQNYNKDSIKDRMIRTAMKFWGLEKSENLDPLVKLMIEALSSEVYTISDDIKNIEIRLLEKLAEVLIPSARTTALPAHAVLCAQPLESEYALTTECSVYYDDFLFNKKQKVRNLTFVPICDIPLKKGRVSHIICNGSCYSIDMRLEKHPVESSFTPDVAGSAWIALDMDPHVRSLQDLSFYIDFPNTNSKMEYARLLQFTSWSLDGQLVTTFSGIKTAEEKNGNSLWSILEQYNTIRMIDRDIYERYKSNFITIVNEVRFSPVNYPPELSEWVNSSAVLQQEFDRGRLWFHVQFPPKFLPEIMEDLTVCINAVPVSQKTLRTANSELNEYVNIVPLPTKENEHFLSVQSVYDSHNRRYLEFSDKGGYGLEEGTYSVRSGGCERFDSRDAKEYLIRLVDLLDEETAIFSSLLKDKITGMAEEMLQLLNRMKLTISAMKENRDILHYLIMDCREKKETITAKYWSTYGELGNGIDSGTPVTPTLGTEIDSHNVFLLSATKGGKRPMSALKRIDQFKNTLISRNRIITTEDIIDFCRTEYSGIVSEVQVKRGIAISGSPHGGLVRTIDVYISIASHATENTNLEDFQCSLMTRLSNRSPETFNYRIKIQ